MSVGEALRELGEFLDECEESGGVTSVELTDDTDSPSGDPLTAEIDVELSADHLGRGDPGLSLRETTVNQGGELRLVLESPTPVVPSADHDVETEVTDAAIEADGSVTATISASVAVDDEASTTADAGATASTGGSSDALHERDVPPFRDRELLEEVYDSCETFAEMTDAIGMDVTAETVRRYMIDHGIHEPDSYDTADERESTPADTDDATSDSAAPDTDDADTDGTEIDGEETGADGDAQHVVLTDGIGLPDDVTVEALIETVKRSNTILEVKRDLDIERQEALDMLRRLEMVDLVVGRLESDTERDITRADVIERLREASATA